MRSLLRFAFAAALCCVCVVSAFAQEAPPSDQPDQSAPADQSAPPDESDQPADTSAPAPPSGPIIQPMNPSPVICDPNTAGFRYLELRGSGFGAWAGQRLAGTTLDANGTALVQWNSVWVTPQGRLTLELNLCGDPYRGRPALPAGTYTVAVGNGGRAIAATSFDLTPPQDTSVPADQVEPSLPVDVTVTPAPSATSATPLVNQQPTATPFPTYTMPVLPNSTPTPVPTPRTGLGSQEEPFPIGMPGLLADGFQLTVTGVTPDAWTGIHDAVPSNTQAPSADQRDFEVRVQALYQGQYTGTFSGMRLALIGPNGVLYDQLHNSCGTLPDSVPPNLLTPGGVARGNTCFVVRATDIPFLVLVDNQVTPNDRQYFALH